MSSVSVVSSGLSGRAVLLGSGLLPLGDAVFAPFLVGEIPVPDGAQPAKNGFALRIELTDGRVLRTRAKSGDQIVADELAETPTWEQQSSGETDEIAVSASKPVSLGRSRSAPREDAARAVLYHRAGEPRQHGFWLEGDARDILLQCETGGSTGKGAISLATLFTTHLGKEIAPITLVLPRFNARLRVGTRVGQAPQVSMDHMDNQFAKTMLDILAARAPSAPDIVYNTIFSGQQDNDVFNSIISGQEDTSIVEQIAEGFLRDKFTSPDQAAVGGFYLLKARKLERVRTWSRNLADYFLELPDGPVLEGWRRLSQGPESNVLYPDWRMNKPPPSSAARPDPNAMPPDDPLRDAAERFTDAAQRGVPLVADGVRRLASGIDFCWRRLPEDRRPQGLKQARDRARLWDQALVPGTALTVLVGVPDDLDLRVGRREIRLPFPKPHE